MATPVALKKRPHVIHIDELRKSNFIVHSFFSIFYKFWKRTNVLQLFLSEFPSIVNNSPLKLTKKLYKEEKRSCNEKMQILCRPRTLGVVHLHCGVHSSSISFFSVCRLVLEFVNCLMVALLIFRSILKKNV